MSNDPQNATYQSRLYDIDVHYELAATCPDEVSREHAQPSGVSERVGMKDRSPKDCFVFTGFFLDAFDLNKYGPGYSKGTPDPDRGGCNCK